MIAVDPKTKPRIDLETLGRYDQELRKLEAAEVNGSPEAHAKAFALLAEMALVHGTTSIVIECCNCAFERLTDQAIG